MHKYLLTVVSIFKGKFVKKTLIPKYLWFFCNRLKKLQNPTRQTKNRYIEGGEDWDEFIT